MGKLIAGLTVASLLTVFLVSWDDASQKQLEKNAINAELQISASDQARMVGHFNQIYNSEGNFKTEVVKVKVSDLLSVIEGLDGAETVDFFLAAYQEQDLERYQIKVPEMSSVTNIPTLIIGNSTRYAGNQVYYDFGTFCPPPYPCSGY